MKTVNEELEKLLSLSGDAFEARLLLIKQTYTSEEDKKLLSSALLAEMNNTATEMVCLEKKIDEMISIKEQLKDIQEIVSLSYIAKKYFGKTRAWLYQRINGYPVRGKVYTLSENEKETLNNALKEISQKIGSLSVN